MKIRTLLIPNLALILTACAAQHVVPGADRIEVVSQEPSRDVCQYLGEVVGSQGNWITGDFTSNENLVIGARNDLRNKAHELGANVVYIENHSNTNAWGSLGTTNTTVIGKAFLCQ